jgi:acetyl-CoA carboxylase biotin carboxyl carrier protein
VLTFEQIKELIEMVAQHRLAGVDLENGGFRFKVDGYPGQSGGPAPAPPAAPPTPVQHYAPVPFAAFAEKELAQPAAAAPAPAEKAPEDDGGHVLNSPIVGTFYRSPNPQSPAFVEVGQRVTKGQVLCIIEAMKLMNEIESDVDGVVAQIYPQNAQPVEFGEPLFRIKT